MGSPSSLSMINAFLLCVLPLTLLLLSIKLVLFSNKRSVNLPPSPWKLPFIGNLHQLGLLPHQSLHNLSKKHGPLMLLQLGQVPTLVVSSSQMAKEILKTHDLVFASRPTLRAAEILLYGSLDMAFSPYGEHWRQMRKICATNLFSTRRVQLFQAAREEVVVHLLDKIMSQASTTPSEPLNMSQVLYFFSNDMLCRAILGKASTNLEDRNKMFHEMIEENSVLLSGFNLEDYFPSLGWLSSILGLDERAKRNSSKWDAVLNQIIQEHAIGNEEIVKDDDFVDILLSLQKDPNMEITITDGHIKALLVDLFAAGTDTTYIVLEWSMAELIKNPQVMKKLQNEVRAKSKDKSMIIKEEDIREMSYLKAVIKEVLRLHPPAPLLVPRESMDNCQIEHYEIPRKTRVVVNYWSIARDSKVWESSETFKAERFINNSIDYKGQDFEYIPFGSGRRVCPGMQFAVSTIELALANLIYRFDWRVPNGMVTEELDMSESPGLTVRMKKNLYLIPKLWI
ncbi:cytochrome P450 71A1-like [Dioscorea cayenensis subsp. rotundata]|uniref:Cytochrome P450 71A1-like n=1 Tax=Dioscorea cayennensis subsp. rotundata TaxID=55577 RepID=A0AB40CFI3_DIOCR|nr:cytochrome P450 71A1-like [Dioscorea cayenensis subsp. rotundata]